VISTLPQGGRAAALPSDVRRWLAPPGECTFMPGLRLQIAFEISSISLRRAQPKTNGTATGGASHRRTSDGKAESRAFLKALPGSSHRTHKRARCREATHRLRYAVTKKSLLL